MQTNLNPFELLAVVRGLGFEPSSLDFQSNAITRLAYHALRRDEFPTPKLLHSHCLANRYGTLPFISPIFQKTKNPNLLGSGLILLVILIHYIIISAEPFSRYDKQ